jgi:ribosomal protein S30
MPGLEISLPGGGSVNSKTGRITPPKPKKLPTPLQETPKQYDARLKKAIADAKKKPKR